MKKLFPITIFTLFIISSVSAQNENDNCPSLFTRSTIKNPKVQITKVEVVDSNKFTVLPQFVLDKNSISELIIYTEIVKRAGVQGHVVVKINLDTNGNVTKGKIIKGIGGGCDEAALDVLSKSKFYPAEIKKEKAESEIEVWINFYLIDFVDKPANYIDEIEYKVYANLIENQKVLKLNKLGEAYYFESENYEKVSKKEGNIPLGLFTKLNDFIISQCFQKYEHSFESSKHFPDPVITIKINFGSTENYVSFRESDNIPVGLWALNKLILYVKDQINWEEVKE